MVINVFIGILTVEKFYYNDLTFKEKFPENFRTQI